MPSGFGYVAAALVATLGVGLSQAVANDAKQDAAASEPKTLKERLGDKASDDQRVDNCKVPVAERGSKVRPDDCSHGHAAGN
ncbi:hypothetical protein [Paraburkholderia azotifigens]|uniref:Uncharacterized protein n=1 Tax=Paraburkholderia azotifigens TaxID=2057004 RepID=A0A5C6VCQ8_9BURK|nr:hypothetical protein [Paraburkholderia azotifigens]TXC82594.1 hypothetical protein FRZ40_19230 [Paraburkholderia azotifigens]